MTQRTRYDSNRVKLRTGEYQKADGHYEYRYTVFGKRYSIYAKNLETLREKESQILSVKTANQEKFNSRTTTLNDVFSLWKELKRGLRPMARNPRYGTWRSIPPRAGSCSRPSGPALRGCRDSPATHRVPSSDTPPGTAAP